jgi:hypothetical protein
MMHVQKDPLGKDKASNWFVPEKLSASDSNEYSRVHARRHPLLRRLVTTMRDENLLLISPEGNIVYSVSKAPDCGTNLTVGPYSKSSLTRDLGEIQEARQKATLQAKRGPPTTYRLMA